MYDFCNTCFLSFIARLMPSKNLALSLVVIFAIGPVFSAPIGFTCWVRSVAQVNVSTAEIVFTEDGRGFGAIMTPGATVPDSNFKMGGGVIYENDKEASSLRLINGKEAFLSSGHESCSFSWIEQDDRPGILIKATSSYPPGQPPKRDERFAPLDGKQ